MPTTKNDRPTRRVQWLFVTVTLCYWCSMYTYVPILSPYLEDIRFNYGLIGIVLGSYGFMQLAVRFPLGLFSDRLGKRKPFVLLGFATSALGCLMFLLFQDAVGVTAARAMTGVAASTWVAFTVLYASWFPPEWATRAMGMLSFATGAGQLIGMGMSGFLADAWGYAATFRAGLAVALIGGLAALFIRESGNPSARNPMRTADLLEVTRDRTLLRVSGLSILGHAVLFITMFGFTPSYAVKIGAGQAELSVLVFAFMIPHTAASWLAANRMAPRLGPWRTVLSGFILSGICTAAIPFIPNLPLLYATQAVNGFAQGMHLPLLLGLAIQTIDPRKRATAMGFYQAVYALGMFSGPFLAGWLNDGFGLAGGFAFGALAAFAAAAFILYGNRRLVARATSATGKERIL